MRIPSFLTGGAIALSVLVQVPAIQAEEATARDDSGTIEEIVVTSRRREESQQDVPLSVTAFGQEAIDAIKPKTLRDFDGLAPNLYVGMNTAGPGASAIFIRGVGYADIEKTQSPQVGVVVDVSEPAEFAAGHAAGARSVPLATIEASKDLPSNKSLPLIVLCPNGSRASRAATTLRKAGYAAAVPLAGGTAAWREAQLPLEKSAA